MQKFVNSKEKQRKGQELSSMCYVMHFSILGIPLNKYLTSLLLVSHKIKSIHTLRYFTHFILLHTSNVRHRPTYSFYCIITTT